LIIALLLGLSAAACARESEIRQTQLAFSGIQGVPELAVDSSGTTYALDTENDRVLSLTEGASSSTALPQFRE